MTRASKAVAACVATTAALALAGCDDDGGDAPAREVDTAQIEREIEQQLSVRGAAVSSVKCPADVSAETGTTFECAVTWDNGATGDVEVTETAANQYAFMPVSGSVQVPGTAADAAVEQQLAAEGYPDAVVDCPENIVVKTGTTVTCDVRGAGAAGTVTFTFSTAQGTVDPESVQTG